MKYQTGTVTYFTKPFLFHLKKVTGKPPVPLQTKNKRKRGTSCENSSFFVFCISTVTGKPPVPLQTKNKRKRGTSCENSSFFVFRISTRPASLLARLFHLGNPLFAFFRKLLRPWKQILQEIQIRIIHVFRNLGQQMRNVVEDIQIVEFAGFHNAVDDGTGFGSVDGVD